MTYRQGDSYLIDDETGFKILRSESVKRWDGAMVHRSVTNPRQPQDLVRARPDRQIAMPVRPTAADIFIGPLCTEISAVSGIGATILTVVSSVRMLAGDRITIMLDNGNTFSTFITDTTDTVHITIAPALPFGVSVGNVVTNYTAMSNAALP